MTTIEERILRCFRKDRLAIRGGAMRGRFTRVLFRSCAA
jgi:hypothetical protein